MADRRISKRLKDKVMSTCVTPACLYGTELVRSRLQWAEHVERMADESLPKRAAELREQGRRRRGRPRLR